MILDEDQIRATEQALREKVLVITGGPGTGKTTLLMALLSILRRAKANFALAAPNRAGGKTHGRERRRRSDDDPPVARIQPARGRLSAQRR